MARSPAGGHLYWDLLAQWSHVRRGTARRGAARLGEIASVGVDTWGVDFGLLGRGDELLGNPVHYRDPRTDGMLERPFDVVPREKIFAHTGLQFMQFNTLYQLWAMRLASSPLLDVRRVAADDARPVPLAADRREGERIHQRHDDAVLRSAAQGLGPRAA